MDDDCNFCTTKQSDHTWTLKQNHVYYYQVQTQMHNCRREYCDFIVWSEKDGTLVERVPADSDFFDNIAGDLQHFFVYGI